MANLCLHGQQEKWLGWASHSGVVLASMNTRLSPILVGFSAAAYLKPATVPLPKRASRSLVLKVLMQMSTKSGEDGDDPALAGVRVQKQALRRIVRARMREHYVDGMHQLLCDESLRVWDRVYELPEYQQAKTVGLFLSMPQGEIQTDSIINHAIGCGKVVYVPRVGANFEHADMELIPCPTVPDFYKAWPRNKWQIPEPPPGAIEESGIAAQPGDLDLVIVPGLAFDAQGGRLGQGKGYYDRFLAKMRSHHNTTTTAKPSLVAVGLTQQLIDHIPMDEHDFRMEIVVLPDQTIRVL
jgi:5-formyltetrahydrofolate cyclo-ligase